MMVFVDRFKTYIISGLGLVFLLSLTWGFRVDHLRAMYLSRLEVIRIDLDEVGISTEDKNPVNGVKVAIADRDKYKAERDTARTLVDIQSSSIDQLHIETEAANTLAEENRKIADEAIRQRDFWIDKARTASTRTERRSAEEELAECEAVLNSLYSAGF